MPAMSALSSLNVCALVLLFVLMRFDSSLGLGNEDLPRRRMPRFVPSLGKGCEKGTLPTTACRFLIWFVKVGKDWGCEEVLAQDQPRPRTAIGTGAATASVGHDRPPAPSPSSSYSLAKVT